MTPPIEHILSELKDLRNKLNNHELYRSLKTMEDIKFFMEQHVFAVWDFMSLLKALQNQLTNTNVPWVPSGTGKSARFINEIVMGEESDVNECNEVKSHFEMYMDAMNEINAKTDKIQTFITEIVQGNTMKNAAKKAQIPNEILNFIEFTMSVIATNKTHQIAAAFTFGREDVIPDMFLKIIDQSMSENKEAHYVKLLYYLNRHIEVDGDEHGPLSLAMIEELCLEDHNKWEEVLSTAKEALRQRIKLWDFICNGIKSKRHLSTINV
jgi:hypothetical protein